MHLSVASRSFRSLSAIKAVSRLLFTSCSSCLAFMLSFPAPYFGYRMRLANTQAIGRFVSVMLLICRGGIIGIYQRVGIFVKRHDVSNHL